MTWGIKKQSYLLWFLFFLCFCFIFFPLEEDKKKSSENSEDCLCWKNVDLASWPSAETRWAVFKNSLGLGMLGQWVTMIRELIAASKKYENIEVGVNHGRRHCREGWREHVEFCTSPVQFEKCFPVFHVIPYTIVLRELQKCCSYCRGWKAPVEIQDLLLKPGHLDQVAQDHVQLGFEHLQPQAVHSLSG